MCIAILLNQLNLASKLYPDFRKGFDRRNDNNYLSHTSSQWQNGLVKSIHYDLIAVFLPNFSKNGLLTNDIIRISLQ